VRREGARSRVTTAGRSFLIALKSSLGGLTMRGLVDGTPFCAQVEQMGLDYRVAYNDVALLERVLSRCGVALCG
jgi:hypothetical protein